MFLRDRLVSSRAYVDARCGKWFAWHDFATGATPTLYVIGECSIEIPGVQVMLRRAAVQGPNPRILVLDTVATAAADAGREGWMRTSVRYDEATIAKYTQVIIQPGEVLVDVVVSP